MKSEMFTWSQFGTNEDYVDIGSRLVRKKLPFSDAKIWSMNFP